MASVSGNPDMFVTEGLIENYMSVDIFATSAILEASDKAKGGLQSTYENLQLSTQT